MTPQFSMGFHCAFHVFSYVFHGFGGDFLDFSWICNGFSLILDGFESLEATHTRELACARSSR